MGYTEYSCALGVGDNTVNKWAPFSTSMEWEIARWAKLRGPSSTALSELLKIDGVCQMILLHPAFSDTFPGR